MTSQSNIAPLFGGGQQQAPSPDQSNLPQQIQSLQVAAMMIARSNPVLAPAMRQIIQIAHAAMNQAAQTQGGGGPVASPPPA
jgi:hypothetical protein